jgi:hypothetical protein
MMPEEERSWPVHGPREGWSVVVLVVLMGLLLGWAIDEPAWVNGRGALTDGLALMAVLGATAGLLGAKVGWGRWTTHLVGGAFAGLVIPILAGWASAPGATPWEAFRFTAEGTVDAYLDLAWRGQLLTDQEVHYTLTLGGLVWGTMQFAAYAVFGHGRPVSAVVIPGLVLLGNMALTARDQLPHLMLFSAAGLFLLVQMHAFDERATWTRRRIGDPGQLASLYLRGGTVFIVVAVIGSLLLTQRAASAPLAGAWTGVVDQLIDWGQDLQRFFPAGGDWKGGGGVSFGSSARIAPRWTTDGEIAFTALVPPNVADQKWRAATYDRFEGNAWTQSQVTAVAVDANQPLLGGLPEEPRADLITAVEIEVTPRDFRDTLLLAPGTPLTVSRRGNLLLAGADGWFAGVDLPGARDPYAVTAAVLKTVEIEGGVTANKLRAASEDYPADIRSLYTTVPEGAIGPDAAALLETVRDLAASDDPYDLAAAMQDHLRSNRFRYTPDVTGIVCDAGAVECFAREKAGYCLHYASTMAILLRAASPENPIPTRLVQGFLPGSRLGSLETVRNRNAHAWVEVYFPGYGWIPFDPTGGNVGQPTRIPEGAPVAPESARPSASAGAVAIPSRDPGGRDEPTEAGPLGPLPGRVAGPAMFLLLTVLLALAIGGVAFAAWARGPREVSADSAWRALARTASRFGFAPRPTQTVYEYAASLGEVLPAAEEDLQTVAVARVETQYGRVSLSDSRLAAVRDAARRLRVRLLRLVLRRPRRRARR